MDQNMQDAVNKTNKLKGKTNKVLAHTVTVKWQKKKNSIPKNKKMKSVVLRMHFSENLGHVINNKSVGSDCLRKKQVSCE